MKAIEQREQLDYRPSFVLFQCLLFLLYLNEREGKTRKERCEKIRECRALWWHAGDAPNLVACAQSNPLRNRAVLLDLLGQNDLGPEGLLRRLMDRKGGEIDACAGAKGRTESKGPMG